MERQTPMPILIAYDGSDNARQALVQAGAFFGSSRPTIVLHVWEPVELAAAHRGASGLSAASSTEEAAASVAAEGVELARAAGLDAEARTVRAGLAPIWETIIDVADVEGVSLIVLGSRGLRGMRTLMLGSVAHQVVHHAHQPVLLIPTSVLVESRRRLAQERPRLELTS